MLDNQQTEVAEFGARLQKKQILFAYLLFISHR